MAQANSSRHTLLRMIDDDVRDDSTPLSFWPWLFSNILAIVIAVASVAGIFFERIYMNETASWAAQGVGQDIINLLVVVPALVISAHLAAKGSVRALLVWLGLLAYSCYSYLMYAYCTSFGPMFPVYVTALALSFYLLIGGILSTDAAKLQRSVASTTPVRGAGWLLIGVACLFLVMEGTQIVRDLTDGTLPKNAVEVGLRVDPVHVQDLGLFLPGVLVAGVLLLRRQPLGYLLAAPLLVHLVVLGVAVMSMALVMLARGLQTGPEVFVAIGATTILSLLTVWGFLRSVGRRKGCCGNCAVCESDARVGEPI